MSTSQALYLLYGFPKVGGVKDGKTEKVLNEIKLITSFILDKEIGSIRSLSGQV